MTKPTDRQIKAVEDVLRGLVVITGDSTWDMNYVAKAALTAAAEVAEQERKDNCRHWRKTGFAWRYGSRRGYSLGFQEAIERCAQVADRLMVPGVAEEIRALKDKP